MEHTPELWALVATQQEADETDVSVCFEPSLAEAIMAARVSASAHSTEGSVYVEQQHSPKVGGARFECSSKHPDNGPMLHIAVVGLEQGEWLDL